MKKKIGYICPWAVVAMTGVGVLLWVNIKGNGNLKGICALCIGKKATDVKQTLKGITCGGKPTSCPDQLAEALGQMGY